MNESTENIEPVESIASGGRAWRHYALVGAVAAVIVLWQLGASTMEDHECFLALTARTMADPDPQPWMIESDLPYQVPPHTWWNHWTVPVENAQPRLVKTPLPYWVAALLARACGGVTNWTARLPAAACAILLGWVTLALGRRMFPPRAALLGAIMLVTCVSFQRWGRDARPEMMLCLLMAAAMTCFYRALESPRRGSHVAWMAAFWVTMGLANLAKEFVPLLLAWPLASFVCLRHSARERGDDVALRLLRTFLIATGAGLAVHLAITNVPALWWWRALHLSEGRGTYLTMGLCLGAPMAWYFLASRSWGAWGRLLPTALPGAAVMLAMFVPWMLYMGKLFPDLAGNVFAMQVTERAAGTGGWKVNSPAEYLLGLITMTLPWLAFLPGAFAVPLMRRFASHRKPLAFLLLWSVGLVVLFSASAAKREHYILPMIPAICLLMGFVAEDVFFRHAWIRLKEARLLGLLHGCAAPAGLVAVGALMLATKGYARWGAMLAVVAVSGIPMGLSGWLAWKGRLRSVVGLVAAAMVIVYLGHYSLWKQWDVRRPIRQFAAQSAGIMPPQDEAFHWGDPSSVLAFYFGRTLPAAQWSFAHQDPSADSNAIDGRVIQWLAQDPRRMPWIFGCDTSEESPSRSVRKREQGSCEDLLRPLGYVPVRRGQMIADKKKQVFTLFHRGALPTSAPAGP